MKNESLLPLAKQKKVNGINVRARDWSTLNVGEPIISVMGYTYCVGSTERETLQNKAIAMLKQKLADARFNKRIIQTLVDEMSLDEAEVEPAEVEEPVELHDETVPVQQFNKNRPVQRFNKNKRARSNVSVHSSSSSSLSSSSGSSASDRVCRWKNRLDTISVSNEGIGNDFCEDDDSFDHIA